MDNLKITNKELDRQIQNAKREEIEWRKSGFITEAVSYDKEKDSISVKFSNGVQLLIPRICIKELDNVPVHILENITINTLQDTIYWKDIDFGYDSYALLLDILNLRKIFDSYAGRRAGQVKSEAKAKSSRENGKKGGRPKRAA